MKHKIGYLISLVAFLWSVSLAGQASLANAADLSVTEAERIAEEAYIFAYPIAQNYKTLYLRMIAGKRPFNVFSHRSTLLDPSYTNIVGPNNDTLYSAAWLDLRSEPMVLSVPEIAEQRYYSLQFIDAFTHNFAYVGQRTTGSNAGTYIITGPSSQGLLNAVQLKNIGVDAQFHSESDLVFLIGRILAKDESDQAIAAKITQRYQLRPLSEYLGEPSGMSQPLPKFVPYDPERAVGLTFIEYTNLMLQFVETHPSEIDIMGRLAKIGIGADQLIGRDTNTAEINDAILRGFASAHQKIVDKSELIGRLVNGWSTTESAFGPRSVMQNQYLLRSAAAMTGLYGNDREENSSFIARIDNQGRILDGSNSSYQLRFEKGEFPPANGFWSLTMYTLPEVSMYENEIRRYSIGDRTSSLVYANDGSLTLQLKHDRPTDPESIANWLPAPDNSFAVALRVYLPEKSVQRGIWKPPAIQRLPK